MLNDLLEELLQRRHHLASAVRRDVLRFVSNFNATSMWSQTSPCEEVFESASLYETTICKRNLYFGLFLLQNVQFLVLHHHTLLIHHESRYPLSLSSILFAIDHPYRHFKSEMIHFTSDLHHTSFLPLLPIRCRCSERPVCFVFLRLQQDILTQIFGVLSILRFALHL